MGITVIGTGYVGLVAGACFAKLGQNVTCVESDSAKLEALRQGKLPIHEPQLEELVAAHIHRNLHFTRHPKTGVAASDVVILAVGTPPLADGSADLSQLFNAARQLAPYLNPETNLVIKSTVP
ncbi:MAG: NAD-binding protein, partial [Pseudomonadota bacterium]|nr:NAD-binding protein [Pseudomonadota bacterium]